MTNNTYEFIENALTELSSDFAIPKNIIPHMIALLEKYPDMSVRGSQKGLYDGLERIIETLKNEGMLL